MAAAILVVVLALASAQPKHDEARREEIRVWLRSVVADWNRKR